jgi:hypothetical protein
MTDTLAKLLDEIEVAVMRRERIVARACSTGIAKPPFGARVMTAAINYAKAAIVSDSPSSISDALKELRDLNRAKGNNDGA